MKIEGKLSAKDVCSISVLREGIGLQGHGGFVGEASHRAVRAALQEGVGLGENATRRIRCHTSWPRQIGGRDDAVPTVLAHEELAREVGLTIICATQRSLLLAQVNECGP